MDEYKMPEDKQETDEEKEIQNTSILIKNGRVVDPVSGTDEVIDVFIKNNVIEEIGHDINAADFTPKNLIILRLLMQMA